MDIPQTIRMSCVKSCLLVLSFFSVARLSASEDVGYPLSLPVCEPSAKIQDCVLKNKHVRLLPVDYSSSLKGRPLTLTSGQAIFGLPKTKIPNISITNGSSDVIISGVSAERVVFSPGLKVFSRNILRNVSADIVASDSKLINNKFIRVLGKLIFDDTDSGLARGNVFIGCHAHGSYPAITLVGNNNDQSGGNTFIWYSFQTPAGTATRITRQKDITFAGLAAESWNFLFRDKSWAPLINVQETGRLNIFGAGYGGVRSPYRTPFLKSDAHENVLVNIYGSSASGLKDQNNFMSPWSIADLDTIKLRSDASHTWAHPISSLLKIEITGNDLQRTSLQDTNLLINFPKLGDQKNVIEKSLFADNILSATKIDSSLLLQNEINNSESGIIFLPPGIFYIGRPIILRNGQGIVGSGSNNTHIVALADIDMIIPSPQSGTAKNVSFTLANLSLEKGRNGIHAYSDFSGPYVLQDLFIEDVTIMGMRDSGFKMDNIQGMDNNFLDQLKFIDNDIGFNQMHHIPDGGRDDGHLNYVDKVIFYRSQFIGNRIGINLDAGRQDNQNAWIDSLFENNTESGIVIKHNDNPLIVNSMFIDNGSVDVDNVNLNAEFNTPLTIIGSSFESGRAGHVFVRGRFSALSTSLKTNSSIKNYSYLERLCVIKSANVMASLKTDSLYTRQSTFTGSATDCELKAGS